MIANALCKSDIESLGRSLASGQRARGFLGCLHQQQAADASGKYFNEIKLLTTVVSGAPDAWKVTKPFVYTTGPALASKSLPHRFAQLRPILVEEGCREPVCLPPPSLPPPQPTLAYLHIKGKEELALG